MPWCSLPCLGPEGPFLGHGLGGAANVIVRVVHVGRQAQAPGGCGNEAVLFIKRLKQGSTVGARYGNNADSSAEAVCFGGKGPGPRVAEPVLKGADMGLQLRLDGLGPQRAMERCGFPTMAPRAASSRWPRDSNFRAPPGPGLRRRPSPAPPRRARGFECGLPAPTGCRPPWAP